ncbi:MAG: outer membrane protein assembly factor BamD [Methylococcales bacterium]|nr:outer membrane protein assembly factor BamD [Methylococcales bacterium]
MLQHNGDLMRFFFKLTLLLALTLTGCGGMIDDLLGRDTGELSDDKYSGKNESELLKEAEQATEAGNYTKAVELYETMQSRFPFGDLAAQALLNSAYAYYKNGDSEAALAAIERFVQMHPRNPSIDYAYYLKGLVEYNRNIGFIDRFLPTDSSQRDITSVQQAYLYFEEMLNRFPNTQYAEDARQRMTALRNTMAWHELHIARYYLKRKAFLAAANRAHAIVSQYDRTPAVPYALQLLEQCYNELNMAKLAEDTTRIYSLNFPDGPLVEEHANRTLAGKVWDFLGWEQ